jgi:hypothetical protein
MRGQRLAPHTISTVSHRRLSHRICVVVLVLAVLPALLLSLAGCGGGGGAAAPEPAAADGDRARALQASAPGELLGYVRDRIRQRAAARAADPNADVDGSSAAPPLTFATGPATAAASVVSSSTVQEPGVDEPDLIKSDGTLVFTLHPNAVEQGVITPRLRSYRRLADGSLQAVASLNAAAAAPNPVVSRGLLWAPGARRVAMLSESVQVSTLEPCTSIGQCVGGGITGLPFAVVSSSTVEVQLASADGNGGLSAGDRFSLSGRLVGARQVGNTLVIVSTHTPDLPADRLPANAAEGQREALLSALRTQDLLPTLRVNGGAARALLADTDCWLQPGNASTGIQLTSITTLDLSAAGAQPVSRCIVGGSEALYLSNSTLVLATARTRYLASNLATIATYPPQFKTDIHKFSFAGAGPAGVQYRGSATVDGHLGFDPVKKPQRISEFNGDIRVLTFTGSSGWGAAPSAATPSPATLTVLREAAGGTLQELARLPNSARPQALGKPGEQVYAVRFIGNRGYVVTFRLIDPLYVLDLSNPADPRVQGSVEVPGVSEHLFPVPGAAPGLLFGVGRSTDAGGNVDGLKFSLIDATGNGDPVERASLVAGNRFSRTGLDDALQAINFALAGTTARVALPALLFSGGGVPGTPSQGLQRFDIDLSGPAVLRTRPAIPSSASAGSSLWTERSLQVGNDLYYLSNGELTRWAW